jgi:hypothetical protein
MLNFECLDEVNDKFEFCFTDPGGDESVKVIVSKTTALEIRKELNKKFCYAATVKKRSNTGRTTEDSRD